MLTNVIEGHLNESDELKASLDAAGVVGSWDWHPTSRTIRYDRGGADLLAGDPDLAGERLDENVGWKNIHPADFDRLREAVRNRSESGGAFAAEYRVLTREHGVRVVVSRGQIFTDPFGRAVNGRGLLIDVTNTRSGAEDALLATKASTHGELHDAVDHCLEAFRCLQNDGTPILRTLISSVLMEAARELAKRMRSRD